MIPTRRDLHFRLRPGSVGNWHARGRHVTHFINAMSLTFPHGERYFIHTVRHYRDRLTDPLLQQAVAAFVGQEAMHGREHEDYNRLLALAGLPAVELEASTERFMDRLKTWLPAAAQLSVTIAQEHFTAVIAELILTEPRLIEGADSRLSALWRWHALEEIEHKAVAFDVYETVMGRGPGSYALRSASMVLTTAAFLSLVLVFQQRLLSADATKRRSEGLGAFLGFMLIAPGLLPRMAPQWLAYFRPGFHPWDHDNRHLLKQLDELVAETEGYLRQAA